MPPAEAPVRTSIKIFSSSLVSGFKLERARPSEILSGTADSRFTALDPRIPKVVGHLVGAIFHQAHFHDWIRVEEMNDHIRILDDRAIGLKTLIINGTIEPERDLGPAAKALLQVLFDSRISKHGESLEQARQR